MNLHGRKPVVLPACRQAGNKKKLKKCPDVHRDALPFFNQEILTRLLYHPNRLSPIGFLAVLEACSVHLHGVFVYLDLEKAASDALHFDARVLELLLQMIEHRLMAWITGRVDDSLGPAAFILQFRHDKERVVRRWRKRQCGHGDFIERHASPLCWGGLSGT